MAEELQKEPTPKGQVEEVKEMEEKEGSKEPATDVAEKVTEQLIVGAGPLSMRLHMVKKEVRIKVGAKLKLMKTRTKESKCKVLLKYLGFGF